MSNQEASEKDQELPEGTSHGNLTDNKTLRVNNPDHLEHSEVAGLVFATVTEHVNRQNAPHPVVADRPYIDSSVEKAIREGKMPGGSEGAMLKKQMEKYDEQHKEGDPDEISNS